MRRVLIFLLVLLLFSSPLTAPAKKSKHAEQQSDSSAAPPTAGKQDLNSQLDQLFNKPDLNKSLDDALSKPLPAFEKPLPAAENLLPPIVQPELKGEAQETGEVKVLELAAPPVLKGAACINRSHIGASQEDPDAGDHELMVEWDRWRNRFLRAVQLQVQATVNNPYPDEPVRQQFDPITGYPIPRFPLGTEAWFDCTVTSDRRVAKVRIVQSSGIPEYDRAIIDGVRALEGTSLLQFPRNSRRLEVTQQAGIRTSQTSEYHYHNFGDVERYRAPADY